MINNTIDDLTKIIEEAFSKRNKPYYGNIVDINENKKYAMPFWVFMMCANIFEYFIKHNKGVTFEDILYLDTYSSGHIDYDRTLLYAAEQLFNRK